MIRVLQAIRTVDSRQTGGPEELLLACSPIMRGRGQFNPVVLLLRKPDPSADPARDFGTRARALGIPVLALQNMRWQMRWLRSLPRRLKVEVIHVHGQRANYFIWLMRRLFPRTWGRLPLVATVHGWVQDNFVRKVVTRLELRTLRECDHVITVSELQRQTLISQGFNADHVSVVRPGIPHLNVGPGAGDQLLTPDSLPIILSANDGTSQASPPQGTVSKSSDMVPRLERQAARQRWGIPSDAYVIAAVGRLSTEKRFDLYIETCAALVPLLPKATFLLVGGGKEEANLKALAATHELGERLIFTGLTREMPSIYACADLLMITSDTEGIPHVLLEAMAHGIPVVATAVGGIPEIITDGAQGLLVPPDNRDALVSAALRVHDEPGLAQRLAAGGIQMAGNFTVERLAEGMEQVYRQVLGTSK
ncbi:MAG: glycosyltransferase family 4 protein [Chloroflexota bacterium]|nr:glycosyltransferase family 4 protein [Chloroflexota bacterium]